MAAVDHRAEVSIHNIRESTQEHRATKSELALTRQQLYDARADADRWKQLHSNLENKYAVQEAELSKTRTSLDAVLKELNAKKVTLDSLINANERLKRDLVRTSATHHMNRPPPRQGPNSPSRLNTANGQRPATTSMSLDRSALAAAASSDAPAGGRYDGDPFDTQGPLPLYVRRCFESDVDPHPTVLRALYTGCDLVCGEERNPISFRQLSCLIDVFRTKDYLALHELAHWPEFTRVSVCCGDGPAIGKDSLRCNQEGYALLPDLLERLPTLASLRIVGLEDSPAAAIAGAIAVATNLKELELPLLRLRDDGFQYIMKVVSNREPNNSSTAHTGFDAVSPASNSPTRRVGSESPRVRGSAIRVTDLDLSETSLSEGRSFGLISGPSLVSLSFEGMAGLQDNFLGEVIAACPNLASLNISRCTNLTKDVTMFINLGKQIKTSKMVGCVAIHTLRLYYVEELHSDLRCVTHVDAPELRRLPVPLATFNVVSFEAPHLTNIAIQGTILTRREFGILSECLALEEVAFVNCRLSDLGSYLSRARQLRSLGVHACKGVVDADLRVLCSTIETLDLTDCFCVTDKVLKSIGESLRVHLSRLTLKRCSSVTDGGLSYLSALTQLEYINLLGMRRVTNEGIARLCRSVVSLTHVVHETFTTGDLRVDRGDVEDAELDRIHEEERKMASYRQNVALSYTSAQSPTVSPRTPQRPGTSSDASGLRPGSSRFGTIGSIDDGVPNGWKSPARMSRPATTESPQRQPPTTDVQQQGDATQPQGPAAAAAGGEHEVTTTPL